MIGMARAIPTLPVTDIDRAREFYEEKLGLKPLTTSDADVMYGLAEGTRLYLYRRSPSPTDHTEVSFTVEDLEAEVADLKAKGVRFEAYDLPDLKTDENNIAVVDAHRAAWFRDPDGNILAIDDNYE